MFLDYFYFAAALVFSSFYAIKAIDIFGVENAKDKYWTWRLHQRRFNFSGSILGWAAAWFVARKTWHYLQMGSPGQMNWSDLALVGIAFVGITGHFPYATAGLLQGTKELASKLTGLGK